MYPIVRSAAAVPCWPEVVAPGARAFNAPSWNLSISNSNICCAGLPLTALEPALNASLCREARGPKAESLDRAVIQSPSGANRPRGKSGLE
ncbi:MAG: hypothetical protein JWO04_2288 [Gammaproteobacteria bacterium]|nr:hypothetical protein [Gammaproteobacteria bacterium]